MKIVSPLSNRFLKYKLTKNRPLHQFQILFQPLLIDSLKNVFLCTSGYFTR